MRETDRLGGETPKEWFVDRGDFLPLVEEMRKYLASVKRRPVNGSGREIMPDEEPDSVMVAGVKMCPRP